MSFHYYISSFSEFPGDSNFFMHEQSEFQYDPFPYISPAAGETQGCGRYRTGRRRSFLQPLEKLRDAAATGLADGAVINSPLRQNFAQCT